jgi:flagellar basal-body rod protein FlgB
LGPIQLFELASQQARWLTVRQATVAENISNANTPGFSARDVPAFEDVLDNMQLGMATTGPGHVGVDTLEDSTNSLKNTTPWEVTESGNSVSIEQEMIKAAEVQRKYSMNTAIVKAFNQMVTMSLKG